MFILIGLFQLISLGIDYLFILSRTNEPSNMMHNSSVYLYILINGPGLMGKKGTKTYNDTLNTEESLR